MQILDIFMLQAWNTINSTSMYLRIDKLILLVVWSAPRIIKWGWLGQIKTKVAAPQSMYRTLLLTEGVVSKQPPPYPTNFDPQAWSTHQLLGQSLGYPAVPTKSPSPLPFWTQGWPGPRLRLAPSENLVATFNEIRQIYIYIYRCMWVPW